MLGVGLHRRQNRLYLQYRRGGTHWRSIKKAKIRNQKTNGCHERSWMLAKHSGCVDTWRGVADQMLQGMGETSTDVHARVDNRIVMALNCCPAIYIYMAVYYADRQSAVHSVVWRSRGSTRSPCRIFCPFRFRLKHFEPRLKWEKRRRSWGIEHRRENKRFSYKLL